jgi:hypothetical protein
MVQALPSLQLVGQDEGGSQVSPGSTTVLPHRAEQSESVTALQPVGQQPSPPMQVLMVVWLQATLQLAALPVSWSMVQALPSLQLFGQEKDGSQVSPGSTTSLPHRAEQSESVRALQPVGQHASPPVQVVMVVWLQATLQLAALPVSWSMVQALPSLQLVGQEAEGSQVSPGSTTSLPQRAEQSESVLASHPTGQQLSPEVQVLMVVWLQATLQLAALPVSWSMVQALPSPQVVGQEAEGSQVSPGSTVLLPQLAEQSPSVLALHPAGQHRSPEVQLLMVVWLQATLQLAALPVSWSMVQALPSPQVVGQEAEGSQVSPGSTTLLPQLAEQSASRRPLHAVGQHPSPAAQVVMAVWRQAASQVAALPVISSMVHALPSLQVPGQDDIGSQVSPGSNVPLPQVGAGAQ